jgi:hypothetical protein
VAHPPSASAQAAANAQALRCSSFVFLSLTLNPFQHRQKVCISPSNWRGVFYTICFAKQARTQVFPSITSPVTSFATAPGRGSPAPHT